MKQSYLCLLLAIVSNTPAFSTETNTSPRATVLFIDDQKMNRDIVARTFTNASNAQTFELELVDSRTKAIEKIIQGKHYDLVISDLETGDEDVKPNVFAQTVRRNSKELEGLFLYTAASSADLSQDPELQGFDQIIPKDAKKLLEASTKIHIECQRKKSLEGTSPRHIFLYEEENIIAPLLPGARSGF